MLTREQAEILYMLLDEALQRVHWQNLLEHLTSEEMGYSEAELEDAHKALADMAGRDGGLM